MNNTETMPVAAKKERPYHVGLKSLGFCLILIGSGLLYSLFNGPEAAIFLMKCSPVVLIVFGLELFVASFFHSDKSIRISFVCALLSFLICAGGTIFGLFGNEISDTYYNSAYWRQRDLEYEQIVLNAIDMNDIRHYYTNLEVYPASLLRNSIREYPLSVHGTINFETPDHETIEEFLVNAYNLVHAISTDVALAYTNEIYIYGSTAVGRVSVYLDNTRNTAYTKEKIEELLTIESFDIEGVNQGYYDTNTHTYIYYDSDGNQRSIA